MSGPRRIVVTPGEPAGVGPELVARLALDSHAVELVAIADPTLLEQRARLLGLPLKIDVIDASAEPVAHTPGRLRVVPVHLVRESVPGRVDPANGRYVLATLDAATDLCRSGRASAMVTGPVQKSVINDAGIPFTGHTEYLAQRTGAATPVMMLAIPELRVALATTHLALAEVPRHITRDSLERVARVLYTDLRDKFGLPTPRVLVAGLNPHAGEGGHLGREEIEIITPVLEKLRREDMDFVGPLPADTLFTPKHLETADAVLAMYHDQGLPVLKHIGFGRTVNVTLGLPIVRTSVDHGTALDLAGSGRADNGSLAAALALAIELGGN